MSRVHIYIIAIPNLAFLDKVCGDFCVEHGYAMKTYGPWVVVVRWLGSAFPSGSRVMPPETCFSSAFMPSFLTLSKDHFLAPLVWLTRFLFYSPLPFQG